MCHFKRFCLWLSLFSLLLIMFPLPVAAAPARQTDITSIPSMDGASGELVLAAGVLPSSVFDPNEIGWASIRGLSSNAFSDHFNEMKDDYMMIDIEVDEIDGEQRVSAIWQANPEDRGWAEWRNLTSDEFHTKWTELKNAGYRLVDQESYTLDSDRYYAGIWVENKENLAWASYRNQTTEEFSQRFQEFKNAGYIMVDVEGYPTSDGLRYSMIWVENVENLGWVEWRNLSSDEFAQKFDEYKANYRMVDVESYRHSGQQYYAGIWVENKNGRGWYEYRDMTEQQYRNRWYQLRDLGYRLIDFNIYPTAHGERYAGIWRQNSDRPDWPLRDEVDDLVQGHLDDFDVPGIGVAIAQGGEIQYMRGFGHQNVNNDVWYSARTLNRLASVGKTVAGVLTLHLLEQGDLTDLDANSTDLVPTMPEHHTHTIRQLLANRSGIGHYTNYDVPIQQYDTALAASQAFWNVDSNPGQAGVQLVYAPGGGCQYSTHAYTILGAVLEAATGQSISDLVENELSAPFNLSTLQAENRDDGDDNRATLYDEDNDEVAADDISWKVLGGGLEVSAYDLVRFGMMTIDGTIINADSLAELQQAPQPIPCTDPDWGNLSNYALGLQAGTEDGTPVLWKGGNQRGANTHLRIYPEKEIVIAVLANRNEGHSTGDVARAIGALLLDNESAAGAPSPYQFGGFRHQVLGNVQAFFNNAQQLVLSGFGAQGDGGVRSALGRAHLWHSDLQLHFNIQSRLPMTTLFTAQDEAGRMLSSLALHATQNGLVAKPNFGGGNYRIQYLLDDTIVDDLTEGDKPDTQAVVNWDEIWCTVNLPHGLPSEICDVLVSYYENQDGLLEWNLHFAQPLTRDDSARQPLHFNRLRLVQAEETQAAQATHTTVTTMTLQAANLEMLTVRTMQTGSEADLPRLPTAAQTFIFLPLVDR